MSDTKTNISQSTLATDVKANLHEFFRAMCRSPLTESRAYSGLLRWHTAVPYPWFNGVLCQRLAEADENEVIGETIQYFQSRNVTGFTWWSQPDQAEASWRPVLEPLGFVLDSNTPGMAMNLERLPPDAGLPDSVSIRRVEDDATFQSWVSIFIAGYGLPLDWSAPVYDLLTSMGLGLPMRHYLACLGDQPVATATLFLGAGVAGIYNVATIPSARGKGIGSAITATSLREAQAMGIRIGALQASEMGFPVYRRLGFEKVCDMDYFLWTSGNHTE